MSRYFILGPLVYSVKLGQSRNVDFILHAQVYFIIDRAIFKILYAPIIGIKYDIESEWWLQMLQFVVALLLALFWEKPA
jgi:hypothetical protein